MIEWLIAGVPAVIGGILLVYSWTLFIDGSLYGGWFALIFGLALLHPMYKHWRETRALTKLLASIALPDSPAEYDHAQPPSARQRLDDANQRCEDAVSRVDNLLVQARHRLDRATRLFEERAFSPFWEDIEVTSRLTEEFLECIDAIADAADTYATNVVHVDPAEGAVPPFSRPPPGLPTRAAVDPLVDSLSTLTDQAFRDFHFSTIYEQRRNTRILGDALQDVREAIDQLAVATEAAYEHLAHSIEGLRRTTERGFDTVEGRLGDVVGEIASASHGDNLRGRRGQKELTRIRRKL